MHPISADTIDRIMAVDGRASALMIGEFARRLAARDGNWGRIVGLTSGGSSGFPGEVTYGAAKAAQVNYTMSAATELAGFGVTANIVHPPVTDTGWVNDGVRAFVDGSAELTHVATPDEVAVVIAWLCTDEARLVSGTVHATALSVVASARDKSRSTPNTANSTADAICTAFGSRRAPRR